MVRTVVGYVISAQIYINAKIPKGLKGFDLNSFSRISVKKYIFISHIISISFAFLMIYSLQGEETKKAFENPLLPDKSWSLNNNHTKKGKRILLKSSGYFNRDKS